MAELDFLKSDNTSSSDNLNFLQNEKKDNLEFIRSDTTETNNLDFLKGTQELEIFGVPQSQLEEAAPKVQNILTNVKDDIVNFYGDVGVPEGAKIPESKEEKEFFGFGTEQFPTTEVLGLDIIDYKKVYNNSENVQDFSSKIGKHIAKTLVGDAYAVGDAGFKTAFLPIFTGISAFANTAEEIILDTLGEEGFTELELKLFGSNTMKASEISEGFQEAAHIALADIISRAPRVTPKNAFDSVANKVLDKPLKEKIVQEQVKVKAEPYLEVVKENISDVLAKEMSVKTGRNPVELKSQIKSKLDDAQVRASVKKPEYIDNVAKVIDGEVRLYKPIFNPAKNYQPEIAGTVAAQKGAPKKLITRQKVLTNFIKDLNLPIATGRIKSKSTLGQFFPGTETVRIKNKYDVNTAAHEVGHFIEKRIPEITRKLDEPIFKEELKSISYDKNEPIPHEGFAEFMRLYFNAPEVAQKYTPNFFKWFEENVRNDKFITNINGKQVSLKKAITNAQDQFSGYWKQSDIQRIDSKIGYTEAIDSKLGSWSERARAEFIDHQVGFARMEKDLGATDLTLFKKTSGIRQGDNILEGAVDIGIPFATFKNGEYVIAFDKSMSLRKALDPISYDLNNWIRYAVSRSSKELIEQGREKLFTAREIQQGLKLETPVFKKAFADLQIWQKGIADFAQKYGEIITEKQRSNWNRTQYLPYHRVNSSKTGSKKYTNQPSEFTGIKQLTGGRENLKPILDNIVGNARMLIQESVKNRIKLDVLDFIKKYRKQGSGRYIILKPLGKNISKENALTQNIKKQLKENLDQLIEYGLEPTTSKETPLSMVMDMAFDQLGPITQVLTVKNKPKGSEMMMPVIRDGKIKYYQVMDPLLYTAIRGLDKQSPLLTGIGNFLTMPKRIGQATVTLVPDFIVANGIKDTIMSTVMTQSGNKIVLGAIQGIKSRIKKDPNYLEWKANGGDLGSYYVQEGSFKQSIEKFYTNKGINYKQVIDTPRKTLALLEELGALVESANRLGEYAASRRKGKSVTESVYLSKEISTPFDKRGAYASNYGQVLKFLEETVMFLRPAKLGIDRVYRGIAKDPHRRKVAVKTGLLATTSMALALFNSNNPMYQQTEEWDKDTHWHIFIPNARWLEFVITNGRLPHNSIEEAQGYNPQDGSFNPYYIHSRIPKIWEIGSVSSIAERAALRTVDGTIFTKETIEDFYRIMMGNFRINPISQAISPLVEIAMNKNFFTGRDIESQYDKSLQPGLRGASTTTRTAQAIGKKLNLSPPKIEALIRGYFNSFGYYGLTLADQWFFNDSEDLSIKDYPVIKRFTKAQPSRNTLYVKEAYEIIEEIISVNKSARELYKRYDKDNAYKLFNEDNQKFYGAATSTKAGLTNFNRLIQTTENTKTLSQLQELAILIGSATKKKNFVNSLKKQNIWEDLGALKKYLKDDLYMARNKIAENFVKQIERQKEAINE